MAGRPKKQTDEDIDQELITALQQYTDDDEFIAQVLNTTKDMLPARQYKANATRYIDFALWYTAAIKKDIRGIIYWLDAHARDTYGKSVGTDNGESMKIELLEALAKRLPD